MLNIEDALYDHVITPFQESIGEHTGSRATVPGFEFCPCVPIHSPTHCVALGGLLNLSVPQFVWKVGQYNILWNLRHSM